MQQRTSNGIKYLSLHNLVWLIELPVPLRRIVCSTEQLKLFSMNDPLCYLHLLVKSLNHLIMAMQHQMCPIFLNLGRFPVLSQIRQQAPILPLANSFMFHLYNHTSQMLWFSGSFLWSPPKSIVWKWMPPTFPNKHWVDFQKQTN